jgi:general secretion pathway protein G
MAVKRHHQSRRAFSLLELVVVIAILAIVASIAVTRLTSAADGAGDKALASDLSILRKAVDMYQVEHGGSFPSAAAVEQQLTQYTDYNGHPSATKDLTHVFGPYLRTVPPLPFGVRKGRKGIAAADGPGVGWLYDPGNGKVSPNTLASETDEDGNRYSP